MVKVIEITPQPAVRMTGRGKFVNKYAQRYLKYKDDLRLIAGRFVMPQCGYHAIFVIPMPKSWSKKKKAKFNLTPHTNLKDKDNLEKALLDALCGQDKSIWNGEASKVWGYEGKIVIEYGESEEEILANIKAVLGENNDFGNKAK